MTRALFMVDLQLNPFTRNVEEVGRAYDKRYDDDDNVYGNLRRVKTNKKLICRRETARRTVSV